MIQFPMQWLNVFLEWVLLMIRCRRTTVPFANAQSNNKPHIYCNRPTNGGGWLTLRTRTGTKKESKLTWDRNVVFLVWAPASQFQFNEFSDRILCRNAMQIPLAINQSQRRSITLIIPIFDSIDWHFRNPLLTGRYRIGHKKSIWFNGAFRPFLIFAFFTLKRAFHFNLGT